MKKSVIDNFKKGDKFTSWGFEYRVSNIRKSLIVPNRMHVFGKSLIEKGTAFENTEFEFSEAMLVNAVRN